MEEKTNAMHKMKILQKEVVNLCLINAMSVQGGLQLRQSDASRFAIQANADVILGPPSLTPVGMLKAINYHYEDLS